MVRVEVGDLVTYEAHTEALRGIVWVVDHVFVSRHDHQWVARLRTDAPPGRWKKRYVRVVHLRPAPTAVGPGA
jgi:hypothetical protein